MWRHTFRQISRCNSPAPATICWLFSETTCTIGSDLARRFKPSMSFGRFSALTTSTATRTTGLTENFKTCQEIWKTILGGKKVVHRIIQYLRFSILQLYELDMIFKTFIVTSMFNFFVSTKESSMWDNQNIK